MGELFKDIYNCGAANRHKMSTATYGNPVFRERHRTYGNTKSAERLCWRVPMFLLTMMNMHSNPQHYWMYNTMRVLSPYF